MAKKEQKNCTYIGGQAVMEGVMMRGKCAMATAVRDPQGAIQIESERLTPPDKRSKATRAPFVRGLINFVSSLVDGNRILMRSAEVAEAEDVTPTKAKKWLEEKHKVNLNAFWNGVATVLGVILAVALFIGLPMLLTWLLKKTGWLETSSEVLTELWYSLIEGAFRLLIFISYVSLIGLIPSLKRVYMYHGAEHKTITCYEEGKELTVENVRGCARVHDRCGTTFLFIVVFISIIVFSLSNVGITATGLYNLGNDVVDWFIRFGIRLLLLPIVASISYEILRLLAKTKHKFFLIFKFPGLLLQKITTREPEDDMIECAITAFNTVLQMDADPTVPEKIFAVPGKMTALLKNTKKRFADNGIDEEEAEWIFALTLKIPKSAVNTTERILKVAQAKEIIRIVDERLTGRPLWYIIGDTDFCGYKIRVDERVLIPRPETEEMVMMVVGSVEQGNRVLDLCTGSGAIAIALSKELEKRGVEAEVIASDISKDALDLAKRNAKLNYADVTFVESDLFAKVKGKFDVIVTNPPYIPTAEIANLQREVRDYEPHLALDGGSDGMDCYRRIAAEASKHIVKGGVLIMEVGMGEAQEVAKLFKKSSYALIAQDFNGIDRYVKIMF